MSMRWGVTSRPVKREYYNMLICDIGNILKQSDAFLSYLTLFKERLIFWFDNDDYLVYPCASSILTMRGSGEVAERLKAHAWTLHWKCKCRKETEAASVYLPDRANG